MAALAFDDLNMASDMWRNTRYKVVAGFDNNFLQYTLPASVPVMTVCGLMGVVSVWGDIILFTSAKATGLYVPADLFNIRSLPAA